MDIVQEAIDLYENEHYEEAYELVAQFDKYQVDMFFKATGQMTHEERTEGRKLIGAYKIQAEKEKENPSQEDIEKWMKLYDQLCAELEGLK